MALETGDFISELDDNNPPGTDAKSQGDDHLRLIKRAILGSFPAFVGTTGTPKSVALTEDQVNDAALKSADEAISGTWEFQENPNLQNNNSLTGSENGGAVQHELIGVSSADIVNVGNSDLDGRLSALAEFLFRVATIEVAKTVSRAAGSLIIRDRIGTQLKAGFRNPAISPLPDSNHTLTQDDEGRVLRHTGNGNSVSCPVLEQGTAVTVVTSNNTGTTIEANGTTLEYLDGSGTIKSGTRQMAGASVVQLYYRTASTVEVWGNGLT